MKPERAGDGDVGARLLRRDHRHEVWIFLRGLLAVALLVALVWARQRYLV